MAETTERVDVRRALFFERLIRAWDKTITPRLGALIVEALDLETPFDIEVLKQISDTDLVEKIERYVLIGPSGPQGP